jgi:hypothetical protein
VQRRTQHGTENREAIAARKPAENRRVHTLLARFFPRHTPGEWVVVKRNGVMLHRRAWGTVTAGKKGVKMVLVADGVYCRCMKSGKQPGEGLKMEATKEEEETKAGARRWRRHKEEDESEEDTGDGVRDLGAEMDEARSASEGEGGSESGDSSGESPGSAAEADETYVEESAQMKTQHRQPMHQRVNAVGMRGSRRQEEKMVKKQRRTMRTAKWVSKGRARGGA